MHADVLANFLLAQVMIYFIIIVLHYNFLRRRINKMDELDLLPTELKCVNSCEIFLDNYFQTNANSYCDLFEFHFYKEFWYNYQYSDNSVINSGFDQLEGFIRP